MRVLLLIVTICLLLSVGALIVKQLLASAVSAILFIGLFFALAAASR